MLVSVLGLSSCIPDGPIYPYSAVPLIVIKFENSEYYNHVMCKVFTKTYSSKSFLFIDNPDSTYTDLEDGYKLIYPQEMMCSTPDKPLFGWYEGYAKLDEPTLDLVVLDLLLKDYREYRAENPYNHEALTILDSFPKFEFYLFTYKNMGDYQNGLPFYELEFDGHIYKNIYPSTVTPDSAMTAAYDMYMNVLNEIIANDEMEKYCTLYVKDNKVIVDRNP